MTVEVGDVLALYVDKLKYRIDRIVQNNFDKGVTKKYYIHFWFQAIQTEKGVRYQPTFLCRYTRPSPYQMTDHYLWSVDQGGIVTPEWNIPKKEQIAYILANPEKFDKELVIMLRKYCNDKLEKIEDYSINGKIA